MVVVGWGVGVSFVEAFPGSTFLYPEEMSMLPTSYNLFVMIVTVVFSHFMFVTQLCWKSGNLDYKQLTNYQIQFKFI